MKCSFEEFLDRHDLEEKDVVEFGYLGKSGRLSRRDTTLSGKIGNELCTKKYNHLWDDWFKLIEEGSKRAVREMNPFYS